MFESNSRFLEAVGRLKLVQCYEVLWIHIIAICMTKAVKKQSHGCLLGLTFIIIQTFDLKKDTRYICDV